MCFLLSAVSQLLLVDREHGTLFDRYILHGAGSARVINKFDVVSTRGEALDRQSLIVIDLPVFVALAEIPTPRSRARRRHLQVYQRESREIPKPCGLLLRKCAKGCQREYRASDDHSEHKGLTNLRIAYATRAVCDPG
jgi:hypothetical protein